MVALTSTLLREERRLDEESLTAAFIDPSAFARVGADGLTRLDLAVRGARCVGCLRKIERGVGALPGMQTARLNLSTGKLSTAWLTGSLEPAEIARILSRLGYQAAPYDESQEGTHQQAGERFLLRCLAISGFASANVMLLSVSLWAGAGEMDAVTRSFLIWLSALIALPAMAYAGQPFFRSAISVLRVGQTNMDVPISLGVLLASGLSLFEAIRGGGETYFEAAVMLLFLLLIGRFLDARLRRRAQGAARRLARLHIATANRIDPSGAVVAVPARDIEPGNLVFVGCGDQIPVNGIVTEGSSALDASLLTGEMTPMDIAAGCRVHSGAINLTRPIIVEATASRDDSLLAEITRLVEAGEQSRSRYVRLADRAAKLYVPVVHSLALLTFLGWFFIGDIGLHGALVRAISVLIITCPCALGLAVPAVQVVATGRLFERGVLVKTGDALERLAAADKVVFDKTGTLTSPHLTFASREGGTDKDFALAVWLARGSRHPLARALVNAASVAGPAPEASQLHEEPGRGLEVNKEGHRYRLGNRAWCGIVERDEPDAPELWLAHDSDPPVRFTFEDHLRPEAAVTVEGLRRRGLSSELLSGDRARPVAHAAAEAGIDTWKAGLTPADKVDRLKALAKENVRVLMVGDGLNDAPALSNAYVSISPANAIDASQAAADFVLQGKSLAPVLDAIDVARSARRRAFENLTMAAIYNACAIPLAVAGLVTPLIAVIAMSGSSILVTVNALRVAAPHQGTSP